jgi:hypothetical protein
MAPLPSMCLPSEPRKESLGPASPGHERSQRAYRTAGWPVHEPVQVQCQSPKGDGRGATKGTLQIEIHWGKAEQGQNVSGSVRVAPTYSCRASS